MMKGILIILATLALVGCISSAPSKPKKDEPMDFPFGIEIPNDDLHSVDSSNYILPYNPMDPKPTRVVSVQREQPNKIKSSSYTDLERESSNTQKRPTVANVMAEGDDAERSGTPNVDKIKDIALNSREVRLVGPNQKEVEMKDDLPTKVVVALENLQKEAQEVVGQLNEKLDKGWTELKRSEVWGQFNEKLDKGWTDLKGMVEGMVAPSSKSMP